MQVSIEVKTRPLWPLALLIAALLAFATVLFVGNEGDAGEDEAVDVDLSEDESCARYDGMTVLEASAPMPIAMCMDMAGAVPCDIAGQEAVEAISLRGKAGQGEVAAHGDEAASQRGEAVSDEHAVHDIEAMTATSQAFSPFVPDTCPQSVTISVYDHRQDRVIELDMEEYIYRVTASEMPARCDEEALKAQAVAARTYALVKLRGGGCGRQGADICTDSGHCQAYHDAETLARGWGDDAGRLERKVRGAVEATRGLVMTYDGEPINALFHACSGGHTEDVENVYAQALPYLRGVISPGEEEYSGYSSTRRLTDAEFRKRAESMGCALSDAPLSAQVSVDSRTEAGQVAVMRIGEGAISGRQARKAFGLRAQSFELRFEEGSVIFDVRGYGHGVGMSQNGADAMARAGSGFYDILTHYYTGVKIESMYELM